MLHFPGMPERGSEGAPFEVRATIQKGDNGNWRVAFGADQAEDRQALDAFLRYHIGPLDDHLPILVLRRVFYGSGEFEVTRGPDISGTPEQMSELTVWEPSTGVTGQE